MCESTAETAAGSSIPHNVHLLTQSNQLRALHTVVRARDARREDFVSHASRIIRMLIEAGFGLLPFAAHDVETPVGAIYRGLQCAAEVCGVSVVRAGDSMEAELRAMCGGSIPVGKILIQRDRVTKLPHLYYAKLPPDIGDRHVLLLDPMLATGGTAIEATRILIEHGVAEDHIVLVSFIASPEGLQKLCSRYPGIKIVTSSVENGLNPDAYMLPGIGDFGDRFFGTD